MFKRTLCALVALATLGIAGCSQPTIEKPKDLTGDGIEDVVVDIDRGPQSGKWLFIGQEDGTFVRAKRYRTDNGTEYYRTKDKQIYFFDGEIYRLSPQQE
jgi:prolyl oligopeptidase PreP (S9A serine peptidase family)